jgi:hypothetical protein
MSFKKNIVEVTCFLKLQNGGLDQDDVGNHCFFSFSSFAVISQPILKCKPILNL